MIENALLFVANPEFLRERVAGLTVFERHAWTVARAGAKRLWVGSRKPAEAELAALHLPSTLEILWSREGRAENECRPPYVALTADHFVRVETLSHVLRSSYAAAASLDDAAGVPVLQITPFRTDRIVDALRQELPAGSSVFVESPAASPAVIGWLMSTAVKSSDGFMARHFDRRLSLAVSRLLLNTRVTPNMMTILSCAIGAAGALLFLRHDPSASIAGALLVWLHSVLDGCDGELARMRFQESAFGRALDFWGDNLVHVLLFGCLAWGFADADRSALPLALGGAAALGTAGSAWLAYRASGGRAEGAVGQALSWLAQRDFIYLLVLLAFVGRTYEFLWASAVGAVLFFFAMTYQQKPRPLEVSP